MPEPKEGQVRVYRGQTKGYSDKNGRPSLVPTLHRKSGGHWYDPRWLGSMSSFVAQSALLKAGIDFVVAQLWAPALVQHYGPGSHYLDVTRNMEVALWFALNKYHERWLALIEGDDLDKTRDHYFPIAWFTNAAADRDCAPIIYVFDVEVWDGTAFPSHGQLVELLASEQGQKLSKKAERLRRQQAALIYSDPQHGDGPNLAEKIVATFDLALPFNLRGAATTKKPVDYLFPPPQKDEFYKSLISYPSYMMFDPPRLEQPLSVPLVLHSKLAVEGAWNVRVLPNSGDGSHGAPLRLKFTPSPGSAGAQILRDTAITRHITPSPLYAWMVAGNPEPTTLGQRTFRLEDALVLMPEAPLWTFTPSVEDKPTGLGMWLQAELPLGIAGEIAGRSTDNVYMEICPLDVIELGKSANEDLLRAVWVVKEGDDYSVTVFRRGPPGTYAYVVQYRHDQNSGLFNRLGAVASDEVAKAFEDSLKALLLTRMVLKDLSPGNKPPAIYSGLADGKDYLPRPLLQGQWAKPQAVAGTNYVVPKALDGGTYLQASGSPIETPWLPRDQEEAFRELQRFFPLSKSQHYVAWLGASFAEMLAHREKFDDALEVVETAFDAAGATKSELIMANLLILRGKILAAKGYLPDAAGALMGGLKLLDDRGITQSDPQYAEAYSLVTTVFEKMGRGRP
jgi:FRG domain